LRPPGALRATKSFAKTFTAKTFAAKTFAAKTFTEKTFTNESQPIALL
jgi:hypothetical protein